MTVAKKTASHKTYGEPFRRPIRTDARARQVARYLVDDTLPGLFAKLADGSVSRAEKRELAAFTSKAYLPMRVAMDQRVFSPIELRALAEGFWEAAMAAPGNSRDQQFNTLMWQYALVNLNSWSERSVVDDLRRAAKDTRTHRRGPMIKALAGSLNYQGMIWRPKNWGNSPVDATRNFNRTANRVKARLHPASREVRDLQKTQAKLTEWRKRQRAEAMVLPAPVKE